MSEHQLRSFLKKRKYEETQQAAIASKPTSASPLRVGAATAVPSRSARASLWEKKSLTQPKPFTFCTEQRAGKRAKVEIPATSTTTTALLAEVVNHFQCGYLRHIPPPAAAAVAAASHMTPRRTRPKPFIFNTELRANAKGGVAHPSVCNVEESSYVETDPTFIFDAPNQFYDFTKGTPSVESKKRRLDLPQEKAKRPKISNGPSEVPCEDKENATSDPVRPLLAHPHLEKKKGLTMTKPFSFLTETRAAQRDPLKNITLHVQEHTNSTLCSSSLWAVQGSSSADVEKHPVSHSRPLKCSKERRTRLTRPQPFHFITEERARTRKN